MEDEKVFQFEAKLNSARHFQAFFFVLFLVVCSVFIGAYLSLYKEYEFQKEKLETLEWFVYKDSKSKIDLTETSFQNLSDGFNIAVKTLDTHLTGIKINRRYKDSLCQLPWCYYKIFEITVNGNAKTIYTANDPERMENGEI